MLLTDVEDEKCWRQLCDVGDSFGRYRQHPQFFDISANIQKMSQISLFCHQHPKIVTNISNFFNKKDF